MITLWILLIPAIAALLALFVGRNTARRIASLALAIDTVLLLYFFLGSPSPGPDVNAVAAYSVEWIPQLGIRFSLSMDGLSAVLSLMSCVAALAALVGCPSNRRDENLYSSLFLFAVVGVLGVFLATDLALFFMFYEVMLLPALLLIVRWGTGDRGRAAMRFFVFTQTGGLLMLVSILGLHFTYFNETGVRTFDYAALLSTSPTGDLAMLFMLGFFFAFAVKLPLVPFHAWQPAAYSSAPTETAILLSALMAKTAGYGLIRFAVPMFPDAVIGFAPWAFALGLLTIIYASWLAYGQRDIKRLIAYSSAGHLGYVVLGAFAMNDLARSGAIVQMFCHGLSVTGLFVIADHIERRAGTRDLDELGGFWQVAPRLGGISLIFVLATLGLPGLGNFIGEFLVLAGVFQVDNAVGAVAAVGAVLSAAYALRFMQRTFFGPRTSAINLPELPNPALIVCTVLIVALIGIGVRPQALLDFVAPPSREPTQSLAAEDAQ